jgi:ribonuclease HII
MTEIQIGIDEAGVGPLAGPLVAAVVALPYHLRIRGVRDSKKMTEKSRECAIDLIHRSALFYEVRFAQPDQIDREGIWGAWRTLCTELITHVREKFPEHEILIDGNRTVGTLKNIKPVVGGDTIHQCISAASILAKQAQCGAMLDLHKKYPQYKFSDHHGYPTPTHYKTLEEFGPCEAHRKSYRPVQAAYRHAGSKHG